MAKLYPPQIEGTLPSLAIRKGVGTTLVVPFSMNQAVGQNEVGGFEIKVKTIIKNEIILTKESYVFDFKSNEVRFKLTAAEVALFEIGEFYKVQLAYRDLTDTIGYFSTVGVLKCTSQPNVYIKGLDNCSTNMHKYSYVGCYENEGDITEKEYSYRFVLTDNHGNVLKDSGEQIHNVQNNITNSSSSDSFSVPFDLDKDVVHFLQYTITTNNKMVVKTSRYRLMQQELVPMTMPVKLNAELNFDNGYVDLIIDIEQDELLNYYVSGNFVITKSSSLTNFKQWDKVATIEIAGRGPVYMHRKDFAVEQGQTYRYALQQYNDYEMLSERKVTEDIFVDFEDAFLTDGQRSLRIRFNPKISTFKTDLLESKMDTIGGKYPFIFRNDQVEYKEFPIAGLISYQMDENNLFITDEELGLINNNIQRKATGGSNYQQSEKFVKSLLNELDTLIDGAGGPVWQTKWDRLSEAEQQQKRQQREKLAEQLASMEHNYELYAQDKEDLSKDQFKTFDLTAHNYAAERIFKLEVLDWLNNGMPKMFRSPGEGNYIVRLMNVSLSPEDALGRLLHSFTCTAYEIADFNYDNLLYYNLISVDNLTFNHLLYKTIPLSETGWLTGTEYDPEADGDKNPFLDEKGNPIKYPKGEVDFATNEILDGIHTIYSVLFTDMIPGTSIFINNQEIVVGGTGSYFAEYEDGISSIIIPENNYYLGQVTISYYGIAHKDFDLIINEAISEHAARQFVGKSENILDSINNIKTKLLKFYYLKFYKRYIVEVDCKYTKEYYDDKGNRVYLESDYIPGVYYEYDEESRVYKTASAATANVNQTYYFDRFGRNELFFLPQSEEENYQSYFVEHFYYHNSYDDGDNYFDASNVLDLYEFKTDTILVDGELKKLQTGPTYVLKDQVTGKYLVSKEIYKTLEASVKPYFEIYSNVIKIGESAENYSEIDLTLEDNYFLEDEVDFTYICIPNGVYLNCSYKTRDITYAMEDYTTDNTFQGYKENYDNLLEAINKNNFAIDEDYALDITNIESIIHWYQENLVTELINNGSSQEYQAKSQEYLNALEFYEQYLTGQIDVNLVNLSNFTNLEAIAYEMLYNIDDARNSYYSTYEKYLKRLSFLIDKYREGGDYAND